MRALTVGELLDVSFSAVRRNFATLALCTLVVVVPMSILSTLARALMVEDAFEFGAATTIADAEVGAYAAGNLVALALTALGSMLATAGCLRALGDDIAGTGATARESLAFASARVGPLVWISILYFLAIVSGVLLLVVGMVWLWVLFSLCAPALFFEGFRGRSALVRSSDLIAGHWWRVFGAMLVMYLITAVLGAVLGLLISGAILGESDNVVLNASVLTAANIVAYTVSLPLTAALTTYIYCDLRLRKEGFDPAQLARSIQGPGPHVQHSGVAGLPAVPPSHGGFLPPRPPDGG